ncbi:MAG TPA: peptidase S41, partial [Arcobacter sp.]|nr:peptidase S41 [Arcobacter sp.]
MKWNRLLILSMFLSISLLFAKEEVQEENTQSRLESFSKLQTVISAVERFYVDGVKLQE